MNLPKLSVLRPITTAMLLLSVLVFGGIAMERLPLAFLPEADFPFIGVQIPYPNSNPLQIEKEIAKLFTQMSANDPEIFSRRMLEAHLSAGSPEAQLALFYGTKVRARHSNNFILTFEKLLRRAGEVDTENMIQDSLMTNGHGLIYRIVKRHRDNAPAELADHTYTGTYLEF